MDAGRAIFMISLESSAEKGGAEPMSALELVANPDDGKDGEYT